MSIFNAYSTLLLLSISPLLAFVNGNVSDLEFVYPLSEEDRQEWADTHNYFRRLVNDPEAANMRLMTWDEELADLAARVVSTCSFTHTLSSQLKTSAFSQAGENLYAGSHFRFSQMASKEGVTKLWYDEVHYYDYTTRTCQSGKACGHYTQAVWAKSYKVGCAISYCKRIEGGQPSNLVSCNYGPAGNEYFYSEAVSPYLSGPACSQCEEGDMCTDQLCSNTVRDASATTSTLPSTSEAISMTTLATESLASVGFSSTTPTEITLATSDIISTAIPTILPTQETLITTKANTEDSTTLAQTTENSSVTSSFLTIPATNNATATAVKENWTAISTKFTAKSAFTAISTTLLPSEIPNNMTTTTPSSNLTNKAPVSAASLTTNVAPIVTSSASAASKESTSAVFLPANVSSVTTAVVSEITPLTNAASSANTTILTTSAPSNVTSTDETATSATFSPTNTISMVTPVALETSPVTNVASSTKTAILATFAPNNATLTDKTSTSATFSHTNTTLRNLTATLIVLTPTNATSQVNSATFSSDNTSMIKGTTSATFLLSPTSSTVTKSTLATLSPADASSRAAPLTSAVFSTTMPTYTVATSATSNITTVETTSTQTGTTTSVDFDTSAGIQPLYSASITASPRSETAVKDSKTTSFPWITPTSLPKSSTTYLLSALNQVKVSSPFSFLNETSSTSSETDSLIKTKAFNLESTTIGQDSTRPRFSEAFSKLTTAYIATNKSSNSSLLSTIDTLQTDGTPSIEITSSANAAKLISYSSADILPTSILQSKATNSLATFPDFLSSSILSTNLMEHNTKLNTANAMSRSEDTTATVTEANVREAFSVSTRNAFAASESLTVSRTGAAGGVEESSIMTTESLAEPTSSSSAATSSAPQDNAGVVGDGSPLISTKGVTSVSLDVSLPFVTVREEPPPTQNGNQFTAATVDVASVTHNTNQSHPITHNANESIPANESSSLITHNASQPWSTNAKAVSTSTIAPSIETNTPEENFTLEDFVISNTPSIPPLRTSPSISIRSTGSSFTRSSTNGIDMNITEASADPPLDAINSTTSRSTQSSMNSTDLASLMCIRGICTTSFSTTNASRKCEERNFRTFIRAFAIIFACYVYN